MEDKKIANELLRMSRVVGTVHSPGSLRAARRIDPKLLDFLEIRVDAFIGREDDVFSQLSKLKLPLIITVRHPREGGAHLISTAERRKSFRRFLPHAAMVDIELGSARPLADVINDAHERDVKVVLSYHNFRATPSVARLNSIAGTACKSGADILKIATLVSNPRDLATLLFFLHSQKYLPLSVMGMGRYGKVSRLLFAQAGSVLNYGFLDQPQVSGQWPALLLKKRISELTEG